MERQPEYWSGLLRTSENITELLRARGLCAIIQWLVLCQAQWADRTVWKCKLMDDLGANLTLVRSGISFRTDGNYDNPVFILFRGSTPSFSTAKFISKKNVGASFSPFMNECLHLKYAWPQSAKSNGFKANLPELLKELHHLWDEMLSQISQYLHRSFTSRTESISNSSSLLLKIRRPFITIKYYCHWQKAQGKRGKRVRKEHHEKARNL